jgi:hypothetical protein
MTLQQLRERLEGDQYGERYMGEEPSYIKIAKEYQQMGAEDQAALQQVVVEGLTAALPDDSVVARGLLYIATEIRPENALSVLSGWVDPPALERLDAGMQRVVLCAFVELGGVRTAEFWWQQAARLPKMLGPVAVKALHGAGEDYRAVLESLDGRTRFIAELSVGGVR